MVKPHLSGEELSPAGSYSRQPVHNLRHDLAPPVHSRIDPPERAAQERREAKEHPEQTILAQAALDEIIDAEIVARSAQ